jgi:hypothetical protein
MLKRSKSNPLWLRLLTSIGASIALVLALTASECQQDVTFPKTLNEICTDGIDNDADQKIDCEDKDCSTSCTLELTVNQPPNTHDKSVALTGTQKFAKEIKVSIVPKGTDGNATITGTTWTFQALDLQFDTTQVTITATDALGGVKTVTTSFVVIDSTKH